MAREKNMSITITINPDHLHNILCTSLNLANVREFAKANSLLDRTHLLYHDSPIFHLVNAAVRLAQLESHDDPSFKESLGSSAIAIGLAPSNLELSIFYVEVHVLFAEKFEVGILECVRALSVPNPVVLSDDGRFEELNLEADASGVKTVEGRIEFCRRRLRFLKDLARAAIVDPCIVREHKKCMLLARKWYQDRIHIDQKVIQESPNMVQVKSYLESLTDVDMRRHCLEIDVSELREDSTFYKEAYYVLLEALAFAEENCSWKFWFCPVCNEKFGDSDLHLQHVVNEHVNGGLSGEEKELLPQPVSHDWADWLLNESWLPITFRASALRMFGQMPEWDVSNYEKRTKLLKRIGAMFRMLVGYRYLSAGHLDHTLNRAMKHVNPHHRPFPLTKHGMNEGSKLCIRVLDECQLMDILAFLDLLSEACKLGKYSKESCFYDGHDGILDVLDSVNSEALERIILDCDSSKLVVDPGAFCKQSGHNKVSCSCSDDGLRCVLDVEAVVSWLYKGKSWNASFSDWDVWKTLKTSRGSRIFQMLQQEFQLLHDLCTEKRKYCARVGDLKHVEQLCTEEKMKRGNKVEIEFRSYEYILTKVKEDASKEDASKEAERNSELTETVEEVSTVLKMEQTLNGCIALYEEEEVVVSSCSSSLNDKKACIIERAFETLYENASSELYKIDAKILQSLSNVRQLENELAHHCSLDFLPVLTALVKSHLQLSLEGAAEKFVRERHNSACKPHREEEGDPQHTDKGAKPARRSQKKPNGKKKSNRSKN